MKFLQKFYGPIVLAFLVFTALLIICVIPFVFRGCVQGASSGNRTLDAYSITIHHMHELHIDCEDYRRKMGAWPPSLAALTILSSKVNTNNFLDGWGRVIEYKPVPGAPGMMKFSSYGADGVIGGIGTNADISMVFQ